MDNFIRDTCAYFNPMHIFPTSDASPLINVRHKLVQVQPCTLFSLHFPLATLNEGVAKEPRLCDKT